MYKQRMRAIRRHVDDPRIQGLPFRKQSTQGPKLHVGLETIGQVVSINDRFIGIAVDGFNGYIPTNQICASPGILSHHLQLNQHIPVRITSILRRDKTFFGKLDGLSLCGSEIALERKGAR